MKILRSKKYRKKYPGIIMLITLILNSIYVQAQNDNIPRSNRICIGLGAESGFLGIDYSKGILKSKVFLGIGCGIGTGWTGYVRYEPISWKGLGPFISTGISHSFGGTLILAPGSTVFSASGGLNYLPAPEWKLVPVIGLGISYYSLLSGDAEGGLDGFGPLFKIGIAFGK